MSDLTIGLLSALLATNQPQAVSNLVQQQTGISVTVPDAHDPEDAGLRQLMAADDDAMSEINEWISTNSINPTNTFAVQALNSRIHTRLEGLKDGYQTFLRNHPDSAHGFLAYGSFLNDIGDEEGACVQFENSKQLDPKNPAVWNNLANYYGERGGVTNAFADYTEAIRLAPDEPVYYENFATTVYLYRKDVRDFYHLNEGQVFDKALGLYQQAMKLDPTNLVLATDYAECYYGIKPYRTNDSLVAWSNALTIAHSDVEREGVTIHLARMKTAFGLYDSAQADIDSITNSVYAGMKQRLIRSLKDHKNPPPEIPNVPTNNVSITTNLVAIATNTINIVTNEAMPVTNSLFVGTRPVLTGTNYIVGDTNIFKSDIPRQLRGEPMPGKGWVVPGVK